MTSDFTIAVHALVFLHCKQETVSSEMLAKTSAQTGAGAQGDEQIEKAAAWFHQRALWAAI
ncbi:MAG: hypothetical protein ACLUFF_00395 [Acutalibacteraceae bacterium]